MIVVAATLNKHKIAEIGSITRQFGFDIISRNEAGVPDIEIEEDGDTFEENSYKKAAEIMKLCGQVSIADDSGLMVDALDGAPGVISARFAGEAATDQLNNEKLLELLNDVPEPLRTAKFVSVITMVFPDGRTLVARGECLGHVIREPRGEGGFGYDPLFVPVGFTKTFAELTAEEKNRISHRALALQRLKEILDKEV
jgi:XTP/dITP diphosphohydrolase